MPYGNRRLPGNWKAIRTRVLKRDRGQCQVCGEPATEVDHIVNRAAGGTDAPDNLRAICTTCHAAKTRREQDAGRRTNRRKQEQHPGLR